MSRVQVVAACVHITVLAVGLVLLVRECVRARRLDRAMGRLLAHKMRNDLRFVAERLEASDDKR